MVNSCWPACTLVKRIRVVLIDCDPTEHVLGASAAESIKGGLMLMVWCCR